MLNIQGLSPFRARAPRQYFHRLGRYNQSFPEKYRRLDDLPVPQDQVLVELPQLLVRLHLREIRAAGPLTDAKIPSVGQPGELYQMTSIHMGRHLYQVRLYLCRQMSGNA